MFTVELAMRENVTPVHDTLEVRHTLLTKWSISFVYM